MSSNPKFAPDRCKVGELRIRDTANLREIEHSGLKEQAAVDTYTRLPGAGMQRNATETADNAIDCDGAHPPRQPQPRGAAGRPAGHPGGAGAGPASSPTSAKATAGRPRGVFRPLRLWWRPDRGPRPRTLLPARRIFPGLAWCEDPHSRRYNRPFLRSANGPGDGLWRKDRLYDLIVEIDHNTRPRVAGRGSAVFFHVARPDRSPTAGCVAMGVGELSHLARETSIEKRKSKFTCSELVASKGTCANQPRSPKIAVPIRTWVAPWAMAAAKSRAHSH